MTAPLAAAALAPLADKLVGLIPDANARAAFQHEMELKVLEAAVGLARAQAEISRAEAAHGSLFVAGWRPAIGWVGAAGLAYAALLYPLAEWAAALWAPELKPPPLVIEHLLELVMAMLGLGALRSWEKMRGVARASLTEIGHADRDVDRLDDAAVAERLRRDWSRGPG